MERHLLLSTFQPGTSTLSTIHMAYILSVLRTRAGDPDRYLGLQNTLHRPQAGYCHDHFRQGSLGWGVRGAGRALQPAWVRGTTQGCMGTGRAGAPALEGRQWSVQGRRSPDWLCPLHLATEEAPTPQAAAWRPGAKPGGRMRVTLERAAGRPEVRGQTLPHGGTLAGHHVQAT